MRQEFTRGIERVVKLIVYDIIETGVAQRLAGAAVRDIGRANRDDPQRYDQIKAAAITDARRTLARTNIDRVLEESTKKSGDRAGTCAIKRPHVLWMRSRRGVGRSHTGA